MACGCKVAHNGGHNPTQRPESSLRLSARGEKGGGGGQEKSVTRTDVSA